MLDRASERVSYPFEPLSLESMAKVLCVAPHPDDEVLGCGGLLAKLAMMGKVVPSLILTKGEAASDPQTRMNESFVAASRLGLPKPEVLDLGDRRLRYGEILVSIIERTLVNHQADCLLLPSLSEPHPDHQACALAGLKAALLSQVCDRVLFYEVGTPMYPNRWVDIDAVTALKWSAIEAFQSQLTIEPYLESAKALSQLRAFRIPHSPEKDAARVNHAEAFFEVDLAEYRKRGISAAVPHWPWLRFSTNLANDPQDLPGVTVLIRSMNRPSLLDALASVASQTYRPIRVMVVNASSNPLDRSLALDRYSTRTHDGQWPEKADEIEITLIDPREPKGLTRAQAANRLLKALRAQPQSTFAMFLDDDDVIDTDHVERLVRGFERDTESIASYTGVRVVDGDGHIKAVYDKVWSRERLMGINFIPIHGLMFRVEVLRVEEVEFDESLPVLEDWDFWLKLARFGGFTHVPGVSASYRQHLGESKLSEASHRNYWKRWHRMIVERAFKSARPDEVIDCLTWHAIELDACERQMESKHMELQIALSQAATMDHKQREQSLALAQAKRETDARLVEAKDELSTLRVELETARHWSTQAALHYERELARLQQSLHAEAFRVVSLQAKLQEVSELSKQNFHSAETAQSLLAQRQVQIDRAVNELNGLRAQNQLLANELEQNQKSKLWKLMQRFGVFLAKFPRV